MKIYGYKSEDRDNTLLTMREVTFELTSAQAVKLGDFFLKCAADMEVKAGWEHEHFNGDSVPDVIVYKKK